MKKLIALLLTGCMVASIAGCAAAPAAPAAPAAEPAAEEEAAPAEEAAAAEGLIKVGVVNNPPSESGYREANVNDFINVFTADNGYDAKFFYSIKNDEQLSAARQFITDGIDYLLISAAETTGWDAVLKDAQDAGISVFLFDRMIDCDPELFEAAVVSDMAQEGETAVNWLLSLDLPEYNVIHIQGAMGSDAQLGRTGALDAQFESGKMNKVVQQTATWDEAEAKKIVESVINSKEPFNVIYAENDGMAKGAVAALDEAGITHGVDKDVVVMGFDCNKWALRELLAGNWNYDGQCSPFQAQVISDMIQTLESGGTIEGLNDAKQIISVEKGFDAREITEEDIATYGLGE
ncbi:MAG: substrate-binding domain-containing protein [Lachnospiraceae bacterium]|nr:substrate-binding domain-containing protein [Lachnospiraceae bacterium]